MNEPDKDQTLGSNNREAGADLHAVMLNEFVDNLLKTIFQEATKNASKEKPRMHDKRRKPMFVKDYLKSMKPEDQDLTVEEYLKSMKPEDQDLTVEEYLKSMKPEDQDLTVEEYLKSMKPEDQDLTVEEYLKSMKPEDQDLTVEEYLKSMKPEDQDLTVEEYLKSMKPEDQDLTVEEYLKSMKPEDQDLTVEEYLKSMKPEDQDLTVEEYLKSMKPEDQDLTVEEYLKSMKPEDQDLTVEEYLKSMKPEDQDLTVEEYLKSMKPEDQDLTVEEYLKSMKPEDQDLTVEEYLKSMKPEDQDLTVEEYLKSMKPEDQDLTVEEYLKSMKPEDQDLTVEEYLKSMKPEDQDLTVEEYLKSMKPEDQDLTVEEYLKSMKPEDQDLTVEEYLKSMKPEDQDLTVEEYLKSMKPEDQDLTVEEYLKSMKLEDQDLTVEEYLKSMKPEDQDLTVEEYLKSMKPEDQDLTVEEYLKSMKVEGASIKFDVEPRIFELRAISLFYFGDHGNCHLSTDSQSSIEVLRFNVMGRRIIIEDRVVSLVYQCIGDNSSAYTKGFVSFCTNALEESVELPTNDDSFGLFQIDSYGSYSEDDARIILDDISLEEINLNIDDSINQVSNAIDVTEFVDAVEESVVENVRILPRNTDQSCFEDLNDVNSVAQEVVDEDQVCLDELTAFSSLPRRSSYHTEMIVLKIFARSIVRFVTLQFMGFAGSQTEFIETPEEQTVQSTFDSSEADSRDRILVQCSEVSTFFQEIKPGTNREEGSIYKGNQGGRLSSTRKNHPPENWSVSKTKNFVKEVESRVRDSRADSENQPLIPDDFLRGDKPIPKEGKFVNVKEKVESFERGWDERVMEKGCKDATFSKKYRGVEIETTEILDVSDAPQSSALEELPLCMNELKGRAKVSAFLASNREHLISNVGMPDNKEDSNIEKSIEMKRSPFRRSRLRQRRDVPRVVLKRARTLPLRFRKGDESEEETETFTESDDGSSFAITGSPSISPRASLRGRPFHFYSDSEDGTALAISGIRVRHDSDGSSFAVTGGPKYQYGSAQMDKMTESEDGNVSALTAETNNRFIDSQLSGSETIIDSEDGSAFAVTGSSHRRVDSDGSSFVVTGSPSWRSTQNISHFFDSNSEASDPEFLANRERLLSESGSTFAMTGRSQSSVASEEDLSDRSPSLRRSSERKKLATFV